MHWEIGSEFWDVPVNGNRNNLFQEPTQWFLSGRSALQAIIKELHGCHTVAMPSWCCDSMIKPFVDAGFDVHFYPVYWQGILVQEISMDSDVLFIMNYFGYSIAIPNLSEYKGIVIRDETHSIFTSTYSDADYYFGSLRKWCGVWTGGYARTRDGHGLAEGKMSDYCYIALRRKAMQQKSEYLNGSRTDKDYLNLFADAEEMLENKGVFKAAERDVELAYSLDSKKIILQRRANAEILRSAFSKWLIFPDMQYFDCPIFVPIFVPEGKRDSLRRYLIQNEIYCPVHWPVSKYHRLEDRTEIIYKNELSLVCDQRYIEKDMNRIVKIVKEFMEK